MTSTLDCTIAQYKKYFAGDMLTWIESLPIDENKPLSMQIDNPVVRDHVAEAASPSHWMCHKPGPDITITIMDGDQEYVRKFKRKLQEEPLQG